MKLKMFFIRAPALVLNLLRLISGQAGHIGLDASRGKDTRTLWGAGVPRRARSEGWPPRSR